MQITALPEIVEVTHLDDHLNYITDTGVRAKVTALLDEIKTWKPGNISVDAVKNAISIKINGRVFAYLYPRRKHYILATFDTEDEWKEFAIKGDDDLDNVKPSMRAAMERRMK